MTTEAKIRPRLRAGDASAPLGHSVILFLACFFFIALPAFFHQFFSSPEEQVSVFSSAYGLRLFYPGSNRIMMVMPLITSWLQTPRRIMTALLFINVLSISTAIAVFAHALPRKLFFPFCLSLLVAIVIIFGGGGYQFHLSVVQPYLASTALGLICTTIVLTTSRSGPAYILQAIGLLVLTVAVAGINPSVSMLFMTFFSLHLFVAVLTSAGRPRFSIASQWQNAASIFQRNGNLVFGVMLNLIATCFIFFCYGWYKTNFPQYVRSNYSVDSYLASGLSFRELADSFEYMLSFHDGPGLLGPSITRWIISAVLVSGVVSFGLWRYRKKNSQHLAKFYLVAFLLWLSSMLVFVVLSQNAHIQVVPNLIRGRYFTSAYYVMILALCLTAATFAAEIVGDRPACRYTKLSMLAVAIIAVVGSFLLHIVNWGAPSFAIIRDQNATVAVAAAHVKAANVPVVLGNYWWIWNIQYLLNNDAASSPHVTPIAFRTESFGLNVFKPMLDALARAKSFPFFCVELKEPSVGNDESCDSQISFFQVQNGFPTGDITELSRSEAGEYKFTLYELGLVNTADSADCTASQILLRAKPVASSVPGQDSYNLDEDSFVYLQRPDARADWVLRFTQSSREEVVIVPRVGQSYFHLLGHRISVLGSGCRLLLTVSRRDRLYPATIKLDVR